MDVFNREARPNIVHTGAFKTTQPSAAPGSTRARPSPGFLDLSPLAPFFYSKRTALSADRTRVPPVLQRQSASLFAPKRLGTALG